MINDKQRHDIVIRSLTFILLLAFILALSACEGRKYPLVYVKNLSQMENEVVQIEGDVTNSDIHAYTIVDDNGEDIRVRVLHELRMRLPHRDQRVSVQGIVMRDPTGGIYLSELSYQPVGADPSRLRVYIAYFLICTTMAFLAIWLVSAFRLRHRKALEKDADSESGQSDSAG